MEIMEMPLMMKLFRGDDCNKCFVYIKPKCAYLFLVYWMRTKLTRVRLLHICTCISSRMFDDHINPIPFHLISSFIVCEKTDYMNHTPAFGILESNSWYICFKIPIKKY